MRLTNLTELDVSSNRSITTKGIMNLKLKKLNMSDTKLIRDDAIRNMTSLTWLDIAYSKITRAGISNLTNLTHLEAKW
jgi:Leucine-rich repeat (LRR) protein